MKIYAKLAEARINLQNTELKKSGKNKHLGFQYYELQDFLPPINIINKDLGIISLFSMTDTTATLKLICSEDESIIEFNSPIAEAKLQGKPSPIQELGSQHTYMRRYMYLLAYEIVEYDAIDAGTGAKVYECVTCKTSVTVKNYGAYDPKKDISICKSCNDKRIADIKAKKEAEANAAANAQNQGQDNG